MKKFDIAYDEPFSQIDDLVGDEMFPRVADEEESPDEDTEDEDADDDPAARGASPRLSDSHAIRVARHGRRPIREDAADADVLGEDVEYLHDVAVALDCRANGLV